MVRSITDSAPGDASLATRIVGIGASAGGFVALEGFLSRVPRHSGLAYLVVQHLDPTQKALLAELLQRVTAMPVREASKACRVEPDCVYVIPPNAEISVVNGALNLEKPDEPRGLRLPINVLFSSLASDQGERAIAVVLSGMGSDGTLGLQAIKAVGGLTVVQQPDTAQFDLMPKSAIAAGCGDIVAPPAELPARILAYIAQVPDPGDRRGRLSGTAQLRSCTASFRYCSREPATTSRSTNPALCIAVSSDAWQFTTSPTCRSTRNFCEHNPQEIDLLFKELLIGVTSFFRDAGGVGAPGGGRAAGTAGATYEQPKLRAWLIGCSTGEEAYSLAMVFTEAVQRMCHPIRLHPADFRVGSEPRCDRDRTPWPLSGFDRVPTCLPRGSRDSSAPTKTTTRSTRDIRDMVLFAQHDVVLDPPFTKLDLIVCRNLLIYFDATLQRRLLPLFHYSLRPGGVLLLGSSETVGKFGNLFARPASRSCGSICARITAPAAPPTF